MSQKAFRFDKTTLQKIGKGALIAITGGAALGLLNYLGTIDISDPLLASIIASVVPILVNTVREYVKES